MAVPRRMTQHTLDALKGWPSPTAVDFTAKLSANVTIDPVYAGRVAYLNSDGELEMGLPDVVAAGHMALFLFTNSDDYDVVNAYDDPTSVAGGWVPVTPSGNMLCFPAKGAYELESTEFEPEATAGTYTPGTTLTATPSNSNATTGGRLTKGTAYAKPVCGVVSRGVRTNAHGIDALAFWPTWLPRQA